VPSNPRVPGSGTVVTVVLLLPLIMAPVLTFIVSVAVVPPVAEVAEMVTVPAVHPVTVFVQKSTVPKVKLPENTGVPPFTIVSLPPVKLKHFSLLGEPGAEAKLVNVPVMMLTVPRLLPH